MGVFSIFLYHKPSLSRPTQEDNLTRSPLTIKEVQFLPTYKSLKFIKLNCMPVTVVQHPCLDLTHSSRPDLRTVVAIDFHTGTHLVNEASRSKGVGSLLPHLNPGKTQGKVQIARH